MPVTNRPPAEEFWRCRRCGTPNPWAPYLTQCVGCGAPHPSRAEASAAASRESAAVPSPGRQRRGRWVAVASGVYVGWILAVLAVLRVLADRWLPATLLSYLPRAAWLLPLLILAPAAAVTRRWRLLAVHAATALVVLGPVMGLSLPLAQLVRARPEGFRLRIMTLNRSRHDLDAERLRRLVERERIDVICVQEYPERQPPDLGLEEPTWHHDQWGSLYSRYPIVEVLPNPVEDFPEYSFWPVRYNRVRIALPDGRRAVIVTAHMPTMRRGFHFARAGDLAAVGRYCDWRWRQLGMLAVTLAETAGEPTLLGADLNTPSDSPMLGLLRRDYRFAFDAAGWGYGYTRPARWPWVRIDHILHSRHWAAERCWVGPDVGSDHLPLIAEVVLPGDKQ